MLACWYYRRLGIPYLDESLRPAVRTAVSRHILRCAGCRDHLRLLQRTTGALRSAAAAAPVPAIPNPQLWNRLEARLAASGTRHRRTVSYPICATGLTAAIACLGSYVFLSMGTSPDDLVPSGLPLPRSAALSVRKPASPGLLSPGPKSFTPAGSPSAVSHGSETNRTSVVADLPMFSFLQADIFGGGANVSGRSVGSSSRPSSIGELPGPGHRLRRGARRLLGAPVRDSAVQAALPRRRRPGSEAMVVAERTANLRPDPVLGAPVSGVGAPVGSASLAGSAATAHTAALRSGDVSPAASDQVRRLASSVIAAGDSLALNGGTMSRNSSDNRAAHSLPPAAPPASPAPERVWFYSEVHSLGPDGRAETSSQVWGQVDPSGAPVFVQNHYSQGEDQ